MPLNVCCLLTWSASQAHPATYLGMPQASPWLLSPGCPALHSMAGGILGACDLKAVAQSHRMQQTVAWLLSMGLQGYHRAAGIT